MTLRNSNNSDGKRHGSTGAESQRSTETVKGPFSFSAVRSMPLKLHTKRQYVLPFLKLHDCAAYRDMARRWTKEGCKRNVWRDFGQEMYWHVRA